METPPPALTLTRILILAWALCGASLVRAEVAVPSLTARVTDLTATLTSQQQSALEQTLRDFEMRKGSQIAVLLVPTTAPETIEQYSLRVVEQWKLGRKQVDDGALFIVAKADRTLRIEVGYGLEGVLNDATSKRIISEVVTPYFRQGDFYGGISAGIDRMIHVIDGEALPPPDARPAGSGMASLERYFPLIFILVLMTGGVLRAVLGRTPGAVAGGAIIAIVTWLLIGVAFIALIAGVLAFLFTLLGSNTGRGIGGYPGGLGGRGGFGGGGFGGGGGGFGGGGASGRW